MGILTKIFLIIIMLACLSVGDTFAEIRTSDHERKSDRVLAASKADLLKAAEKILVLQGFQIQKLDETSGTISTSAGPMRLILNECECGLGMGPIEDARPIIYVSVDIRVSENRASIKARIHGDYPGDQVTEEMIEEDLLNQISRYLD